MTYSEYSSHVSTKTLTDFTVQITVCMFEIDFLTESSHFEVPTSKPDFDNKYVRDRGYSILILIEVLYGLCLV